MITCIVTYYNCKDYIERCLKSIQSQTHPNWQCITVDDVSDDQSYSVAMDATDLDSRFRHVCNLHKRWQVRNYYHTVHKYCEDDDIVVFVDGDDYLSDPNVFNRIQSEYDNHPNLWVTYGSYIGTDGSPGIAQQIPDYDTARQDPWRGSHLKTAKAWLLKRIKYPDICTSNGEPIKFAGDMAIMLPCFEMAGPERCKFLSYVNYIYNVQNPLSEHVVDIRQQLATADDIRKKPRYERI